jgi:hypothetical protein
MRIDHPLVLSVNDIRREHVRQLRHPVDIGGAPPYGIDYTTGRRCRAVDVVATNNWGVPRTIGAMVQLTWHRGSAC